MLKNIYLIECMINGSYIYKIGYTKNPVKLRIKQLQTGNPGEFNIVHEFKSKYATTLESYLHRFYSSKRINNEWFELSYEDIDRFESLCETHEKSMSVLNEYNNPYV